MELYISNSGQEPIYAQITRQIKAKILNGELQQGDALPSTRCRPCVCWRRICPSA